MFEKIDVFQEKSFELPTDSNSRTFERNKDFGLVLFTLGRRKLGVVENSHECFFKRVQLQSHLDSRNELEFLNDVTKLLLILHS